MLAEIDRGDEPDGARNLVDAETGGLEKTLGGDDALVRHPSMGCRPRRRAKPACERPWRHRGDSGQTLDRKWFCEVLQRRLVAGTALIASGIAVVNLVPRSAGSRRNVRARRG